MGRRFVRRRSSSAAVLRYKRRAAGCRAGGTARGLPPEPQALWTNPFRPVSGRSHGRDPAFHLLEAAEKITFVTLAAIGDVLQKRIRTNSAQPTNRKGRKRHALLQKQYANPAFLKAWYDAWATATAPFKGKTFLVRADEGYPTIKTDSLDKLFGS